MIKNLGVIRTNVAREVYDTSSNMLNLITNYINIRYRDILKRANINFYNYDYAITTVAGQKDYPMNEDFGKPIAALDVTNNTELSELYSLESIYRNNPANSTLTSNPIHYVIFESPVMVQPSSALAISIVSSSSADTTQKIIIRGISSSSEITEEITLTGTSAATSTNTFSTIKSISKDNSTYGKITITASTNTLAILSPKTLVSRYKIIRLWPTPASTATINFPYIIKPYPLIEDTDYPIIDIDDIIETGARASAHSYQRREATANKYESLYESMIATYLWDRENSPNGIKQIQPEPYSRSTI